MKRKIKILDLFSGIGGFPKGFMRAGYEIEKHYYSEVDKHAISVYKNNFKDAIYAGPVELIQSGGIERPDVITFGSPCQDFSLAGKRKGMEGERSSLILEAIRLVSELRPSVFLWENVKGAFSSNGGADFWAILQAFANIGGYRLEWQLLNTVWFLPQNRERIYLIGHLAGRSELGVFPIEENDGLFKEKVFAEKRQPQAEYNSTTLRAGSMKATDTFISVPKTAGCLTGGGNSGGLHSDMTTVQIGAIRGRNPDNPSQRIAGQYQEQVLELNQKGVSNTLTSVQKDNLVVKTEVKIKSNTNKGYEVLNEGDSLNFSVPNSKTRRGRVGRGVAQTLDTACNQGVIAKKNYIQWDESGKGHNSQQDRAFYQDGIMGTIPAGRAENKVNVLLNDFKLRRLTEIECERLQGFPQQKIEICLDQIKNHAQNVEGKCRKLQKLVLNVEKTDLPIIAKSAEKKLNIKQAQINKPAQKNVHINFGENGVEIHNQEKLIFSAKNAESENWFHPLIKIEDFALLLVRTNLILEKTILIGKVELQEKEQALIHQKNLKKFVKKYGKGITLPVKDVEKDLIILNLLLKYTTSHHLNTGKDDLILRTWFSFVIHAITGFIPKEIQALNLSNLSLSIDHGWTQYGCYNGKVNRVPKTQRYKMLGNAVTVDVVEAIARRIKIKKT